MSEVKPNRGDPEKPNRGEKTLSAPRPAAVENLPVDVNFHAVLSTSCLRVIKLKFQKINEKSV